MKSNVDLYLEAVSNNLIGSRKRRKALMQHLAADIEDFSEECGGEPTVVELELRFGTASEVADILLKQTDFEAIKGTLTKRRIVVVSAVIAIMVALFTFLGYLAFDNWRKECFVSGFYQEEISENAETSQAENLFVPIEHAKDY